MYRYLPIALVAALLLADGFVHGRWTNRWQPSLELQAASARLERVPMVLGDWQGEALKPISERETQQAGFTAYVNRTYKNYQTGAVVNILLACGRAGPIAVHTPEICYRGAGYQVAAGKSKRVEKAGGMTAELWQANFTKGDPSSPLQLKVLWCWNKGDAWKAPDNPRMAFAGNAALYKLYVVQETMRDDQEASKACADFLGALLPQLNRSLFPKS